jgi:hypothetical protein
VVLAGDVLAHPPTLGPRARDEKMLGWFCFRFSVRVVIRAGPTTE